MAGQEIDRRARAAHGRVVQVGRPHDAADRRLRQPAVALEEGAQVVAVFAVPFRPAVPGRERADLVQPARVPGLRDQLDVAEDGVERQALQQRGLVHRRAVLVPPQDRGQVEPETVHAVVDHPVAQAVQDHLLHDGMVAVERIATAAEIVIAPVGREHVVNVVVKAFEAEKRAVFVPLRRMVKYHVQDHLDPLGVERADQALKLVALMVVPVRGGIARVGREEADRVIAPVIQQALPVHLAAVAHLVKLEDRHQLDRVDPQFL